MNNLNVRAKFVRVHGEIISVDRIVRVYMKVRGHPDGVYKMTYMTLNDNSEKQTNISWDGDIRDEIWDILQAGSDEHLGPHDTLREKVVL